MHIIDRYAYNNRIRRVDPAHKVGLAFTVLLLCLLLNEPLVGLATVGWMYWLAVRLAQLPPRAFGRVLLAEATFLVLATLGVIISLSLTDPRAIIPWAWSIGPLWISSSPDALYQGVTLILRALGCAAAMNFLALTTPLVDMLELFRRWRVPPLLVDLMVIIYRFIFVLFDSLDRMHTAQRSRLGYHTTYMRAMNNAALLGSRLFIDAFQRSRRLQLALDSRSYDGGDIRVLPSRYTTDRKLLRLGPVVAATLVLIWIIV